MTGVVLILTTVPDDGRGEALAQTLVEERLAACVNVLAPMMSIYRWRDTVEREAERQVIVKTTRDRIAAVRERIGQLHSYELPELIVLNVEDGGAAYLDWVRESVVGSQ
jgi:periplasmic divalent cation tolerance protein